MLPLKRPMRNLPASLSRPLPPAPPPHVDFATGLWDSEAVLADPNAVSEDGEPLLVMAASLEPRQRLLPMGKALEPPPVQLLMGKRADGPIGLGAGAEAAPDGQRAYERSRLPRG